MAQGLKGILGGGGGGGFVGELFLNSNGGGGGKNAYEGVRKVKMHGLLVKSVELFDNIIASATVTPFDENIPSKHPAGWVEDDYREAGRIVSVAQSLSVADDVFIRKLSDLIIPFAVSCRKRV